MSAEKIIKDLYDHHKKSNNRLDNLSKQIEDLKKEVEELKNGSTK